MERQLQMWRQGEQHDQHDQVCAIYSEVAGDGDDNNASR